MPPITPPALSSPITPPALASPITPPALASPITPPALASPITRALTCEYAVAVVQIRMEKKQANLSTDTSDGQHHGHGHGEGTGLEPGPDPSRATVDATWLASIDSKLNALLAQTNTGLAYKESDGEASCLWESTELEVTAASMLSRTLEGTKKLAMHRAGSATSFGIPGLRGRKATSEASPTSETTIDRL